MPVALSMSYECGKVGKFLTNNPLSFCHSLTKKRETPLETPGFFFSVCDHNHPRSECGVLREKSIIKMSLLDDLFFREGLKMMQGKKSEWKVLKHRFLILEVLMCWNSFFCVNFLWRFNSSSKTFD